MHPDSIRLRQFCDGALSPAAADLIDEHIRDCEFCREFCDEYRVLNRSMRESGDDSLPPRGEEVADAVYHKALIGRKIPLFPFVPARSAEPACLAADTGDMTPPWIQNLGTFYSEDPEVILRVMRDNREHKDYLQLVSEDESMIAHVLIQSADLDLSLLTDTHGRATLEVPCPDDVTDINWMIKLPDAEFSLEPFTYDAVKTEYEKEVILQTERMDQVAIRFESRADSKRISVRILKLNGRAEFDTVSVAVSQGEKSKIAGISGKDELFFDISGGDDSIDIRLFPS